MTVSNITDDYYPRLLRGILAEHNIQVLHVEPVTEGKAIEPSFRVQTNQCKYFAKFSLPKRFTQADIERFDAVNAKAGNIVLYVPFVSIECSDIGRQLNVYEWISGQNLRSKLALCSENDCCEYGYQAGQLLYSIHQLSFDSAMNSFDVFNRLKSCLNYIDSSGFTFGKAFEYRTYIESNYGILLRNIPCSFVHMDYKPKNMILTESGRIVVVDLDSSCVGDPWLDFYNMSFSLYRSKELFNSLLIRGYFDDRIPDTFWKYFKVLSAFSLIQNTAWLLRRNDLSYIRQIEDYLCDSYFSFDSLIPMWFTQNMN